MSLMEKREGKEASMSTQRETTRRNNKVDDGGATSATTIMTTHDGDDDAVLKLYFEQKCGVALRLKDQKKTRLPAKLWDENPDWWKKFEANVQRPTYGFPTWLGVIVWFLVFFLSWVPSFDYSPVVQGLNRGPKDMNHPGLDALFLSPMCKELREQGVGSGGIYTGGYTCLWSLTQSLDFLFFLIRVMIFGMFLFGIHLCLCMGLGGLFAFPFIWWTASFRMERWIQQMQQYHNLHSTGLVLLWGASPKIAGTYVLEIRDLR
jgi:hypothetical protein